ncbi:MAG: adenosine-specific kinase [Candidatus Nanohaloarchaeota archaeon QJJ-9]|nr:adenosine-specific kinase [Candidatus Nanohaloarchaeota archaeon QJJ-9]
MELEKVKIEKPEGEVNTIIGQSHFIKTVEDLHETLATSVPDAEFGIAFCEASGDRLVRSTGNNEKLKGKAEEEMEKIGAGHSFIIFLKDAYPINVLNQVKQVQEVCRIYCATANPVELIVTETDQGRGILGVVDGKEPVGIEGEEDREERKDLLRKIGYKL